MKNKKTKKTNKKAQIGDLVYLSGNQQMGKGLLKKIVKKVAKVGLVPARAGFLTLVTINARKLATNLAATWKKNPKDVKNLWTKFGGDIEVLKKAIIKGSRVQISGKEMGIVVDAALLASAAAILVPVLALFKKNGTASEEDASGLQGDISTGMNELAKNGDVTTAEMPQDASVALLKDKPTAGSFWSVGGFLFKTLFVLIYSPQTWKDAAPLLFGGAAFLVIVSIAFYILHLIFDFTKLYTYGKERFFKKAS